MKFIISVEQVFTKDYIIEADDYNTARDIANDMEFNPCDGFDTTETSITDIVEEGND